MGEASNSNGQKNGAGQMTHKHLGVVADIWDKKKTKNPTCPKCGSAVTIIQIEPLYDAENAYTPYRTILECSKCDFQLETQSFTILGCVKDFDVKTIEIASWAPSGSRVISHYDHLLDYDTLKKLKKSAELIEFLIVNNQVIEIIS